MAGGRIDAFSRDVDLLVAETLSPAARQKVIAAAAREMLAEAQNDNRLVLGRVPRHDTAVDGRRGAALETVKPDDGRIVFEFELLADVMAWIGKTLVARSPVRSGLYRRSHTLFADHREVALGGVIPEAAEYTFLNPVPYARKIEVGTTKSGRAFVINVPNGIYQRTAAEARRRFGNIASISFTYESPVMTYQRAGTRRAAASRRGGVERQTRVPAIVVRAR